MSDTPGGNYSRLDRLLHRWAFAGIEIQKSLADIEDRMYAGRIAAVAVEKPIFITSLPRAGTTLLLNFVARHAGFVSHTYRRMPFVLCPIVWDSVSRGFRRDHEAKERAHGDGMTIGYDSPEAFEEVLWKAFWPNKYQEHCIKRWLISDHNFEFEEFFRNHIRKLILLNNPASPAGTRYVSKNNANIARIPYLSRVFPDAAFLIPFRDPVDQAGSLLRQHKRFIELHAADAFTRRYMDTIGHFEFGAGLRLIDFAKVSVDGESTDPKTADFWLAYWVAAYTHLLQQDSRQLCFINFEKLCGDPLPTIDALSRKVGQTIAFSRAESETTPFHPAPHYAEASLNLNSNTVARARAVHTELLSRAIH